MRSQSNKEDALKRLAYIEGHLKGIRTMVEDDQYCVDVLKQTYAVQRALDMFEGVLLRTHLNCCIPESLHEDRGLRAGYAAGAQAQSYPAPAEVVERNVSEH